MRHVRMRVVGFAAVLALAAAGYVCESAAALPEFGRCRVAPTHEGRYTDANCTVKAKKANTKFTGEYEWYSALTFPKERTFSNSKNHISSNLFENAGPLGLSGAFVVCEPSGERQEKCREGETEERQPVSVECENIRYADAEYSAKSAKEISHFETVYDECHALGVACANSQGGGGEPEIIPSELKGILGYIKRGAPKEVGIDWKPEFGKVFAKFTCGGMTVVVGAVTGKEGPAYPPKGGGDGVIAAVTPINEMTLDAHQSASVNGETAENVPSQFEGKALQVLEGYFYNPNSLGSGSKWSPAGLTLTESLALCGFCDISEGDEPAEVKA